MPSHDPSPQNPSEITVGWLQTVLHDVAGDATLKGFELEPVGEGLLTTVIRVTLRWDDDNAEPKTVIVKLPSALETNRGINQQFGYDRREVGTYRHLSAHMGSQAPRCHYAALGDLGACIVLQDLVDHRVADQLRGATEAENDAVATAAAAVHAASWNAIDLTTHDFLPGPLSPEVAGYGELFTMTWQIFTTMIGDHISKAQADRALGAMETFDEVLADFASTPNTLVHGDLRLDNVLFDTQARRAVLVDWQLAARGRGAYDLAFYTAGSVEPTSISVAEHTIDVYHDQLCANGVTGYSRSQAWVDFCAGHVMNLPNPVTALVAVQTTTSRAHDLLITNARRALRWLEILDR
jgi:aminoglycoside phosphotransferase (APT) family kinase protein